MPVTSVIRSGFLPPPPDLQRHVDRVWSWNSDTGVALPTILPGTGAELMIACGAALGVRDSEGNVESLPPAFVLCLRSCSRELVCSGPLDFVSVRFRGSGIRHFGQLGMPGLIDGFTDAGAVFGGAVIELAGRLESSASLSDRAAAVWSFLRMQRASHARPDAAADALTDLLYYSDPALRVAELADRVGLSTRQMERTVAATTGLSPKRFRRLARFHRAVRDMHVGGAEDYLAVALEHGYHDQAHFIHECRDFAGRTPGALLRRARVVSHFYNTSLRAGSKVGA